MPRRGRELLPEELTAIAAAIGVIQNTATRTAAANQVMEVLRPFEPRVWNLESGAYERYDWGPWLEICRAKISS